MLVISFKLCLLPAYDEQGGCSYIHNVQRTINCLCSYEGFLYLQIQGFRYLPWHLVKLLVAMTILYITKTLTNYLMSLHYTPAMALTTFFPKRRAWLKLLCEDSLRQTTNPSSTIKRSKIVWAEGRTQFRAPTKVIHFGVGCLTEMQYIHI